MSSPVTEHLFNELNDLYAADAGSLGSYVSGSASYGGMTDESDVDFYVLTSDYHGFLERIHGARRVEVRWRTFDEISLDISRGGPFIYQLMDATILRDPDNKVSELIDDAHARYADFASSQSAVKEVHFQVGEARMKLRSARRSGDGALQAYLCSIYTELVLKAMFVMMDKPVATGTTAWRWIRKTDGVSSQGVGQLEKMLQLPVSEKSAAFDGMLDQLHGVLTAKMKGRM